MISNYIQEWLDVIENMNNDNTYKLAWGRAILETLNEKEVDSEIEIHFDELSPKIIKYYWNQIYFFNLTQGPVKKPIIEQIVHEMIETYQKETNDKIPVWYEKAESYFSNDIYYKKLISKISTVLSENVSWRFMHVNGEDVSLYKLDNKNRIIRFSKQEALDLKNHVFVLSQLLNYRWAQLLELFNTAPRISSKVKGLSSNKIRRNNLTKYKKLLLKMYKGNPVDFYSGKVLQENDISVDHVIPWSFMYSDDIWNLVLTSRSENSIKSNSVPSKETIKRLKERNDDLLLIIDDKIEKEKLEESINNNYIDKFYYSMKM